MIFDVLNQLTDGLDVLNLGVGHFDLKLILDGHQKVYHVQRICTQVLGDGGVVGDGILLHVELLAEDCLYLLKYHNQLPPLPNSPKRLCFSKLLWQDTYGQITTECATIQTVSFPCLYMAAGGFALSISKYY